MVVVAQLVRALVCGTRGRRFESGLPPVERLSEKATSFCFIKAITFTSVWGSAEELA